MKPSELGQLELLAAIDDLRRRVDEWARQETEWEPQRRTQLLLSRVIDRVDTLRIRLEAPLVVSTFGGTGTGKSSLVNALVGEECTLAGRERPTTRRPLLITHSQTELSVLGLPLEEVDIVQRDADVLRDILILDCPDPDTSDDGAAGTNLDRLRTLLPYCDVLLYVSTQQKYRSARVAEELSSAAAGCRVIFVQTHADLDEDIREDWKRTLSGEFEVPEMFFVDSQQALREQRAGQKPTGEMGRLIDLLTTTLGASSRVKIRRANVVDLLQAALTRCREQLESRRSNLKQLSTVLESQKETLAARMAENLESELLSGRSLWERRLLSAVTDHWGLSPFSSVLRAYNGLGGIIASMTLLRARSTAQLALLGTIQGVRWLGEKRKEQEAESSLTRVTRFGLDDALLREAEIVVEGHAQTAGFHRSVLADRTIDQLRQQASAVEDQFIASASRKVDDIIERLSRKNSGWLTRAAYETLFLAYIAFVLYRVGRNFFYDSFWQNQELLSSDFYLAAGLFFVLWTGGLLIMFLWRLRSGLSTQVKQLVREMVNARLQIGLFPKLEAAMRRADASITSIGHLLEETSELRSEIAGTASLGAMKSGAFSRESTGSAHGLSTTSTSSDHEP